MCVQSNANFAVGLISHRVLFDSCGHGMKCRLWRRLGATGNTGLQSMAPRDLNTGRSVRAYGEIRTRDAEYDCREVELGTQSVAVGNLNLGRGIRQQGLNKSLLNPPECADPD